MGEYVNSKLWMTAILSLGMGLSGCEVETFANGSVVDFDTGAPIVGAHVMEIAVSKDSGELLCETYTDSSGSFSMDAGLCGFGSRRVTLQIVVEKDSFASVIGVNNYAALNFRLKHR